MKASSSSGRSSRHDSTWTPALESMRQRLAEHGAVGELEHVLVLVVLVAARSDGPDASKAPLKRGLHREARSAVAPQAHEVPADRNLVGERGDASGERDLALAQKRHPIREAADLLDALRRPQRGGPRAREILNQLAHDARRRRIEVVRRLVDQQHGRIGQRGSRDREPLLHPVGVVADALVGGVLEADGAEDLQTPAHGPPSCASRGGAQRRAGSRRPRAAGRTSGRRTGRSRRGCGGSAPSGSRPRRAPSPFLHAASSVPRGSASASSCRPRCARARRGSRRPRPRARRLEARGARRSAATGFRALMQGGFRGAGAATCSSPAARVVAALCTTALPR